MLAKDIMTSPVITVTPDTTVEELVKIFINQDISAVPVISEEKKLLGIVTEGNLLYKKVKPFMPQYVNFLGANIYYNGIGEYDKSYRKLLAMTAKELMTKNVVIANGDVTLEQVAGAMVMQHLKVMPIVEDNHVIGIITRRDIMKVMFKEYEAVEK